MPRFRTIEELLLELYRHRGLLSGMFGKRYLSVTEEEILPLLDDNPEKLERLVGYGILEKEHNTYSLDSQLREIQHSQKIKHYLRRINRVTLGNVKTLRKKTDDTYKAETNYDVKRDTRIHCLIDEVGILHDTNVRGLINFAAERDIYLINSSPNSHNEEDYKHIYQFSKDHGSNKTEIFKLLSNTV